MRAVKVALPAVQALERYLLLNMRCSSKKVVSVSDLERGSRLCLLVLIVTLLVSPLSGCSDPAVTETADTHPDGAEGVENRGADTDSWWDSLPRPEWEAFERLDEGQGWFEVYRVHPDVLAIYEPGQFEEVISYLILGEDRALLFDTGLGIGDIRAAVNSLTELPEKLA